MKLLLAADIFPPESGGPATYVVTIAKALLAKGHEVKIVSLNPQSDMSVVSCTIYHVTYINKFFRYLQYFWLLWRESRRADAIYAMGPVNAGLPSLLVSRLRGRKFFVKIVGDYAWEQGTQRFGVTELLDEFQTKKYGLKVEFFRLVEKFVARHALRVIVPSLYLKKIVKGWKVEERKIETVYNAIPFVTASPKKKPAGEKWIVSVGRLVPWKGMGVLVEIVQNIRQIIPDVKLKIIGDGPEYENVKFLISNFKLDNVVDLVGNVSHEEALSYISAADVFVLNSGYEGLSHALLEAVHAGVPVLASYAGGNTEVIVGWERGDLFEYNNKEQIQQKILAVLLGQKKLGEWSKEDWPDFLDMFSPEIMIARTERVLCGSRLLMLSLDLKLFEENSAVATRILATHLNNEIFILIPAEVKGDFGSSRRLHVFSRGGKGKIWQFLSLWWLGRKFNRQEKFDLITSQDPFFTGLLGVLIRRPGQSFIVQTHGDFYGGNYYKQSGLGNFVRYYLGLLVLRLSGQIRVVGERIRQSLLRRGIPDKKIYIQPVKVEIVKIQTALLQFDVHRKYVGAEKIFLCLGRLDPVKNIAWLIDVFAEVIKTQSEWKLLIVGDGSERSALKEKVATLNLEHSILFESWTSDPLSFIKTSDGLLFPSLSEGYGMVVIEAVAAGCPVIMNDVGVAHFEVQPSERVKIIPVEKREEWIQAILSL